MFFAILDNAAMFSVLLCQLLISSFRGAARFQNLKSNQGKRNLCQCCNIICPRFIYERIEKYLNYRRDLKKEKN